MKNELNVFNHNYLPLSYWKNWFFNIKQLFKNIKYAWQRATKGYCDCDVWDLRNYLTYIMRDSISELSEIAHGFPGDDTPEGKSYNAWIKYLKKISFLLDKSIDRNFEEVDPYYPNKYEKEYEELISKPDRWIKEEQEDGSVLYTMNETPEEAKLRRKYINECIKNKKKRINDRNKAFEMLINRWESLWD